MPRLLPPLPWLEHNPQDWAQAPNIQSWPHQPHSTACSQVSPLGGGSSAQSWLLVPPEEVVPLLEVLPPLVELVPPLFWLVPPFVIELPPLVSAPPPLETKLPPLETELPPLDEAFPPRDAIPLAPAA